MHNGIEMFKLPASKPTTTTKMKNEESVEPHVKICACEETPMPQDTTNSKYISKIIV